MRRGKWFIMAAMIIVSTMVVPPASEAQVRRLVFVGTVMASSAYTVSAGYARILNQYVPGISVAVQETRGSIEGQTLIRLGRGDIGTSDAAAAYEQYTGTGAFAGKGPWPVMAWLPDKEGPLQMVVLAASPYRTISDLMDVKMNFAPPGSASRATTDRVLNALGLTPKYRDERSLGEGRDAVKNREIVGFSTRGPTPHNAIMDVAAVHPIRLIELSDAEMNKVIAKYPFFFKSKIPAGLYRGIDKDVPVLSLRMCQVISPDLPEELVYQMTKAIFEHIEELRKGVPAARGWDAKNILELSSPVHPGAAKYYQEIGIKLPPKLLPKK